MRMRSPETLRNQGFRGFFFAKIRQEYWTYDLKTLSPLEPLGFLFQCLIHFEPDFEPLLFQLGERFCKINGIGIIFFTNFLIITKQVRRNVTVAETLGKIPPPCMWATNDIFLNRNTYCGTCACIVLVDRINTETAVSGLTGKDIGTITGDLINCIQKIRYFLPEGDRTVLGGFGVLGNHLMLRHSIVLRNLTKHALNGKVAGAVFVGCNVIPMKRTNLSSP